MSEPIWNQFLTERDKAVFAASGYGARGGFGKRPALLVIDVNYAFCGDKPEPILESIKRWRNSCGEESWPAVAAIRTLIDKCHQKGLPVIYTTGVRRDDNWDSGSWSWKNARGGERPVVPATNVDGNEIVAETGINVPQAMLIYVMSRFPFVSITNRPQVRMSVPMMAQGALPCYDDSPALFSHRYFS